MARRRSNYGRKKKIKIKPVLLLILILIVIVASGIKMLSSKTYIDQINEALSSNIIKTTGSVSNTSSIDTKVYLNKGIKYTNKHDNIIKINSFDSSIPEDLNKAETAKKLLKNIGELENSGLVNELSPKKDGYYWIDINTVAEKNKLIFKTEEEYNFDIYYDIAEQKVYVKNKYYDEFNKKNNKTKLQSYKANEECKGIIEELVKSDK